MNRRAFIKLGLATLAQMALGGRGNQAPTMPKDERERLATFYLIGRGQLPVGLYQIMSDSPPPTAAEIDIAYRVLGGPIKAPMGQIWAYPLCPAAGDEYTRNEMREKLRRAKIA